MTLKIKCGTWLWLVEALGGRGLHRMLTVLLDVRKHQ